MVEGEAPAALKRPRTRGECLRVERPCPWRACRYNLTNEPRRRPDGPTCVLDLADAGGMPLEAIGTAFGVTRERVRQLQLLALRHVCLLLWEAGALDDDELRIALGVFAGGLIRPGELAR
jgi:hypothetical protein